MRKNRRRLREHPRLLSRIAHEKAPVPVAGAFFYAQKHHPNPSSVGTVYGSQSFEGSDQTFWLLESRRV